MGVRWVHKAQGFKWVGSESWGGSSRHAASHKWEVDELQGGQVGSEP